MTDGSENANRAVQVAIDLAKRYDTPLLMIHAVAEKIPAYSPMGAPTPDLSSYFDEAEKEGKKLVGIGVEEAKSRGVKASGKVIRTASSVVESILETAKEENVDLIVVGTRGLGGFKRLLLGSVSSGIVSHAHCAVLVVR